MSLGDYAKEISRQAINKIKSAIMQKIRPVIIIVSVIGIFFIIIVGIFAGGVEEVEAAESGMQSATGSQWIFFIENYIKSWEGHEGISEDGTKYKVGLVNGNRTVGYGIDLETSRK